MAKTVGSKQIWERFLTDETAPLQEVGLSNDIVIYSSF
ncbi:hypothetical protein SAMN04488123_10246 [Natribacillus halophilus]|uniref:Uncharacterized protein n=1 Tax=Natribacillus halophilus TaxID=549003 RepID=A0A1G8KDR0_9BACI|nr:hypothetical protein SAMN04488123_10246 [Natribacillus halophilus]